MKEPIDWKKKAQYMGLLVKKGYYKTLHGFEWLIGGSNPNTEEELKGVEIEACLDFEKEKACDRVIGL
jgi:hypothetical protein